jgi:tetratricopeptide (TPR) repeat protein
MKCPSCNSINRDERTQCYHCSADLTVLQTVILKAKHHYNAALEHAERGRLDDAIADLKTAVSLYNDFSQAHNVLGTLYAKQEKWDQAIAQWQQTLNLDPANKKAADYLLKANLNLEEPLYRRQNRLAKQILSAMAIVLAFLLIWQYHIHNLNNSLRQADKLIKQSKYNQAYQLLKPISMSISFAHQNSANMMINQISDTLKTRMVFIKDSLALKQYEQGLAAIKQLHESGIPAQWVNPVNDLEKSLYAGIIERDTTQANQIFNEKRDYWAAKQILTALNKRLTDPQQKDAVSRNMAELKQKWIEQNYKLAVEYQQKKDYTKLTLTIAELQREQLDKELTDKLIQMENQPKNENARQLFVSAQKLIDQKKYNEFLKISAQIDLTYLTDSEKQWLTNQIAKAKSSPKSPTKK